MIEQAVSLCLVCGNVEASITAELQGGGPYRFWPSVDPQSANPFMPYDPLAAIQKGRQKDLPLVVGAVTDEGAVFVGSILNKVIIN